MNEKEIRKAFALANELAGRPRGEHGQFVFKLVFEAALGGTFANPVKDDSDVVDAIHAHSRNVGRHLALVTAAIVHNQTGDDPDTLKTLTDRLKKSAEILQAADEANQRA